MRLFLVVGGKDKPDIFVLSFDECGSLRTTEPRLNPNTWNNTIGARCWQGSDRGSCSAPGAINNVEAFDNYMDGGL